MFGRWTISFSFNCFTFCSLTTRGAPPDEKNALSASCKLRSKQRKVRLRPIARVVIQLYTYLHIVESSNLDVRSVLKSRARARSTCYEG